MPLTLFIKIYIRKRRYFVIYANELFLYYYDTQEKAEQKLLKGKINFSSVHLWDGKPHGFQFYTPLNKLYRVYCSSDEERETWMNVMQNSIDLAPETLDGQVIPRSKPIHISPSRQVPFELGQEVDEGPLTRNNGSLSEEVNDLKSELAIFRAEVMGYRKVEEESEIAIRQKRDSTLPDGTEVHISASEMETMRQIFMLFDTDGR